MMVVDEICDLLQSHANRDKVVGLTGYVLKLWGATAKREELLSASGRFASARITLRLFDDAATLKNIAAYGLGEKDGLFWGTLGVTNGIFALTYLQFEKVVWLIDVGVLKVSKETEFNARTGQMLLWSLSAFIGFIRSLRTLHGAAVVLRSPERPKCAGARYTHASMTTTKLLLDVINAVSWLPHGWLWGGRLSAQQAAAVGSAAAVLALVIHYQGKRLAPSR